MLRTARSRSLSACLEWRGRTHPERERACYRGHTCGHRRPTQSAQRHLCPADSAKSWPRGRRVPLACRPPPCRRSRSASPCWHSARPATRVARTPTTPLTDARSCTRSACRRPRASASPPCRTWRFLCTSAGRRGLAGSRSRAARGGHARVAEGVCRATRVPRCRVVPRDRRRVVHPVVGQALSSLHPHRPR